MNTKEVINMGDKEYIEYLENKIIELEDEIFELEEEIVSLCNGRYYEY